MTFSFGGASGPATSFTPGIITGVQDWNDAATSTTPISLSGIPVGLTNDGLGAFTNLTYKAVGHGNIWNTSTNRFDWGSLKLGDTIDIRMDVTVTITSPNTEIVTDLELAIGSGGDYTLGIDRRSFKNAGTFQIVRWYGIYMGDNNTLNNPGRFVMSSDSSGDSVVVNGWYVKTTIR